MLSKAHQNYKRPNIENNWKIGRPHPYKQSLCTLVPIQGLKSLFATSKKMRSETAIGIRKPSSSPSHFQETENVSKTEIEKLSMWTNQHYS